MNARAKILLFILSSLLVASGARPAELKQRTVKAFNRYVSTTESRMTSDLAHGRFLYIDRLPQAQQRAIYARLARGEIVFDHLVTRDDGRTIPVPGGLVDHWLAVAFIPGARLSQTLALLQDYNHQQDLYEREIAQSKLLSENGGEFHIYLRLYYRAIVHVTYDANFDVKYTPISGTQEVSRSVSTRIAEVDDPGGPDEHEEPVGHDRGFLWRLYTYGRYEQKDGGTYMEIEFVSLSRSIPAFFAWIVKPYLKKIPTGYLTDILGSTRTALTTLPPVASEHSHAPVSTCCRP